MTEYLEPKIRYLEMLQGIITRMESNSIALKGWSVTLIAGIFVLSVKDAKMSFLIIAYVPVFLFWILDSYYLQLQRKYRVLYKVAVKMNPSEIGFIIDAPDAIWNEKTYHLQSFISVTEIAFYLPTGLLVAIVIIISKIIGG